MLGLIQSTSDWDQPIYTPSSHVIRFSGAVIGLLLMENRGNICPALRPPQIRFEQTWPRNRLMCNPIPNQTNYDLTLRIPKLNAASRTFPLLYGVCQSITLVRQRSHVCLYISLRLPHVTFCLFLLLLIRSTLLRVSPVFFRTPKQPFAILVR